MRFRSRYACRASFFWQTIQKKPKNLAPKAQSGFAGFPVLLSQGGGRSTLSASLRSNTRSLGSALPSAARLRLFKGAN